MKIPIIDGIPRDPLDTERCDESLSKSESSGSEESLGSWEKRSDVEGDEVAIEGDEVAIEVDEVVIEGDEVGAIEKSSELDEGAMVGAEVGDDVEESDGTVLGVDPGAVLGLRVGLSVGSGVDTLGVGRVDLGVGLGVDWVGSGVETLEVGSGETLGVGGVGSDVNTLGVGGVGSDVNTLGVGIGVGLSVVRVGSDVETLRVGSGVETLRVGLSVGLGVGLSVDSETLGAGVSCPETLATRREREIYRNFILLSGFWLVSELCEWVRGKLYFCSFDYSLNNYFLFYITIRLTER